MRTLLTSILLLPVFALAELVTVEKPVVCDDAQILLKYFAQSDWNEKPFWIGNDSTSRYTLLVNDKTKTWTLLQFNKETACIIGTGENHRPILSGPKI